jgi:N-methylhydantoinase A
MADKIRTLAAQRGLVLDDFTLVAGGGAGAVHAAAVASELGLRRVLSPPNPGAFSALGLLCTDVIHDYVQSEVRLLCSTPLEYLQAIFDGLEDRARADLRGEGFPDDVVPQFIRELDVRYAGQGFELRVPLSGGPLRAEAKTEVVRTFNDLHRRRRGHSAESEPVEVVSYRLRAQMPVPQYAPSAAATEPAPTAARDACRATRLASFDREGEARQTTIWQRDRLDYGNLLVGPAIVEQVDATTVIPPGWCGRIDRFSNLVLERGGSA